MVHPSFHGPTSTEIGNLSKFVMPAGIQFIPNTINQQQVTNFVLKSKQHLTNNTSIIILIKSCQNKEVVILIQNKKSLGVANYLTLLQLFPKYALES